MDNVTHSLIGLAIGEAVAVHRKRARLPIWIASAAANNLPDLDLLITSFVYPGRLGYLLHHRGHTHTLLAAPALGLFLLLALWLFGRKKGWPWKEVAFVSFLGGIVHLVADSWNSYGVHPFWPFNNEWFYGDMVFIVEPWIWLCLLPTIFYACATKWGKGACVALLLLILGLAWRHDTVPWPAALLLTLGVPALFGATFWARTAGRRISLGLGLVALILGSMFALSHSLERLHARPGAELALHPFPANPFCWSALRATLGEKEYRAEIFTVAPFARVYPAQDCPRMIGQKISAPLSPPLAADSPAQKHWGDFVASRAELESLSGDCRMNAFLRYARIPFWVKFNGGWHVGDLRYDREEGLGFAETYLPPGEIKCPTGVPTWVGRFHPENSRELQ